MARAFTIEEKNKIKEKLMETALELFHDKGAKSLSISELTKKAGIAQGSFYNFWKDKESLILDLVVYRSTQKLNIIEKKFSDSLVNPIDFLTEVIFEYSMDIIDKIRTQPIYDDAFKILWKKENTKVTRIENLYSEFLFKLMKYWKDNKAVTGIDEKGLINSLVGSFILCSNFYHFDKDYFGEILRVYIYSLVSKYIEI